MACYMNAYELHMQGQPTAPVVFVAGRICVQM